MGFFEDLGELNIKVLKMRKDVDGLIKVLATGKHPESREEAAEALGKIGDRRAAEALTEALNDPRHDVRKKAARSLEYLR